MYDVFDVSPNGSICQEAVSLKYDKIVVSAFICYCWTYIQVEGKRGGGGFPVPSKRTAEASSRGGSALLECVSYALKVGAHEGHSLRSWWFLWALDESPHEAAEPTEQSAMQARGDKSLEILEQFT